MMFGVHSRKPEKKETIMTQRREDTDIQEDSNIRYFGMAGYVPQFKRPIILGQIFRPESTLYVTSYFIKRSDVEPILNNYSDYERIAIPLYHFTSGITTSELVFAGTQVELPALRWTKRQQVYIDVHNDAERNEGYGEMMYGPEVYRLIGPYAYDDKAMYLCRLTVEHDVGVLGYQGNEYLNIITHTGDQIRVLMLKDSDIKEKGKD